MTRIGLLFMVACALLHGSASADTASEAAMALVGGTVIDTSDYGRSEKDISNATIIIEGDRITAVGPVGIPIPEGATVVNVDGKYFVPGLIDGFATINNQAYANAHLYGGVTSVIAVSGGRRGELFVDGDPTPTIYPLDSVGSERATTEEHLARVDAVAAQGAKVLLLMYKLSPDQLQPLIARARRHGMGTLGELGFATYADGVYHQVDCFVHTTRYSLGIAPRRMLEAVAENPFSDDLESPKWRYYRFLCGVSAHDEKLARHAKLLARGSVALMPTMSLLYLDQPWAKNPWDEPAARILDPADINNPADRETGRHTHDAEHAVAYASLARSTLVIEEEYRRAGARYLTGSGTDVWGTMPGISIHHELEGLCRIGLTPRQALAAATSNFPATFRGWEVCGEVKAGRRADVLVLSKDPRRDVANLRSIDLMILAGRRIERDKLLEEP